MHAIIMHMMPFLAVQAAASPDESVLALATVVLAAATVILVILGGLSVLAALKQIKVAGKAAATSVKEMKNMADLDHQRRRGEATMAATDRFNRIYDKQHDIILINARSKQARIPEILVLPLDPEVSKALQAELDAVEMLALGARYGFFDFRIIYAMGHSSIDQLWEWSDKFRNECRDGIPNQRKPQPTAYEHFKWLHGQFDTIYEAGKPPLEGILPPLN